jgi:hypothetical protein
MARNRVNSGGAAVGDKKPAAASEPDMKIPASLFDDETARRLIDEWIVPALVEEFLQCHNKQPSSDSSKSDDGDQP